MKRIFILALCVALALSAVVVPASASTYAERWTNVLDYATVNNNGSNTLAVTSGQLFTLDLPGNTVIQDIDILFRLGTAPTSVKVVRDDGTEFPLTVLALGSNLYRAYGNCQGYGFNKLGFKIAFNSTGTSYGQFLQCRVSAQPVDFYNVTASITKDTNVNGPTKHTSASTSTVFSFTSVGEWFVSFDIDKWQGYDYIDFSFLTSGISIGSISAKIGDRSIDVVMESFDGDPTGTYQKIFTGYLDIYGVEHAGANSLELYITGTCDSTSGAKLWLGWLNGIIKVESPSIFALIWQSIKDGFNSVVQWLSNGFNSVVNAITGSFDGLKQEQGQTNDKLDGIIEYQPQPSTPAGGEVVDDYQNQEQELIGSVQGGLGEVESANLSATQYIIQLAGSFAVLTWILNLFFDIPFFTVILYVSMSLGASASILGIVGSVASARSHHEAKSASRETKEV